MHRFNKVLAAIIPLAAFAAHGATPVQAASDTANGAACALIKPFYWEVGSPGGMLVGGSVGGGMYTQNTVIPIASASKWVYGAYVMQARGGQLTDADRQFMTMSSGYSGFGSCTGSLTVGQCAYLGQNAAKNPVTVSEFYYNGGHMQHHAADLMGLGSLNPVQLTSTVNAALGTNFSYGLQLAGGVMTSPGEFAKMLRSMLSGRLIIGQRLGESAVCTNPKTCPTATYTAVPTESWHYSIGHWVEDDPKTGDGAFSSGGAFGFYPWIDATRTSYGIVARKVPAGASGSITCGRAIRKAYATGVAQ